MKFSAAFFVIASAYAAQEQLFLAQSGRSLDAKETTNTFGPHQSWTQTEFNDSQTLGFWLGVIAFGGFILFTIYSLVMDAIHRDKEYDQVVKELEGILRTEFNRSEEDVLAFRAEFEREHKNPNKNKKEDNTLIN